MPHRLVYLSMSVGDPDKATLTDILDSSRRNNGADGITGALFYHDGTYIQVLEGAQDKVTACFDRVRYDARHRGCVVLESGPVDSRIFASWDMGFISITDIPPCDRSDFMDLCRLRHAGKMTQVQRDEMVAIFMRTFLRSIDGPWRPSAPDAAPRPPDSPVGFRSD